MISYAGTMKIMESPVQIAWVLNPASTEGQQLQWGSCPLVHQHVKPQELVGHDNVTLERKSQMPSLI